MRKILGLTAAALLCGCNLVDVMSSENVTGRGPRAFDPYAGAASGAIKLGLQMYKGCAILANGNPVGNRNANIPYPTLCETFMYDGLMGPIPPGPPMAIQSDTTYFLGRLTFVDSVQNVHTDFKNPAAAVSWFKNESFFKDLDWSGVSQIRDAYIRSADQGAIGTYVTYNRSVTFGNAAWMNDLTQTFLVEVLDADANVRASTTYLRTDFLAENRTTYHSRFEWEVGNIGAPRFPHDTEPQPGDPQFGPAYYKTIARLDLSGSTNPFNTFTVPDTLVGDGAIRVTWSAMPNKPAYFPVTFVPKAEVPVTCFGPNDEPVACGYGLNPSVQLGAPENGKYFEPGEAIDVIANIEDNEGNRLHSKTNMPTWNQYIANESNGLLYFNSYAPLSFYEAESISGVKVAGPIQNFRPDYDENNRTFTDNLPQVGETSFAPFDADSSSLPGRADAPISTHTVVKLPENAQPGTWVAIIKTHRQFMGERFSKTRPFFFQVGQEERTQYPNRVGNCQICHRSALSLDNLLHGLSVDHIEACKTCHSIPGEISKIINRIHEVHMYSPKFPREKRDCTSCHLTRESATRPSVQVCNSCHPAIHADKFFDVEFGVNEPNRFSNCAEACHVKQAPTQHILPAQ